MTWCMFQDSLLDNLVPGSWLVGMAVGLLLLVAVLVSDVMLEVLAMYHNKLDHLCNLMYLEQWHPYIILAKCSAYTDQDILVVVSVDFRKMKLFISKKTKNKKILKTHRPWASWLYIWFRCNTAAAFIFAICICINVITQQSKQSAYTFTIAWSWSPNLIIFNWFA